MATYKSFGYNDFLIRSINSSSLTPPSEVIQGEGATYSDLGFSYSLSNRELVLPGFSSEWNLPKYSAAEVRSMFPYFSISSYQISSYIGQSQVFWKWIEAEVPGGGANNTGLKSPSAFSDPNSKWANETNVYTDDNNLTAPSAKFQPLSIYGFDCGLPGGATVDGILFYFTAASATASGSTSLLKWVQLTWDGGTNWSNYVAAVPFPIWSSYFNTTKQVYAVGGIDEDWQHTWTVAQINSTTNFRIRFQPDWATDEIPNIYYIAVVVYYTT